MKKLLAIFIAMLLLCTAVPLSALPAIAVGASTASGTTGDCTWMLVDGHLTISGYGAMADAESNTSGVQLPWGKKIASVTIEDGVTYIGQKSFYNCSSLTKVTIGNSVTTIGDYAFYNCQALSSVTFGNSLITIGEYAFYDCGALQQLILPNGVTTIKYRAFGGCGSLASVTIPSSVITIGERAFRNATALTDVYYGGSVQQAAAISVAGLNTEFLSATWHFSNGIVGEWGKTGDCVWTLQENGLLTISGQGAMRDHAGTYDYVEAWRKATDIVIDSGVTAIGKLAFYGLTIKTVFIPDTVTRIGKEAFRACRSLTEVTIPEKVTEIGEGAFSLCTGLKTAYIYGGTISGTFTGCDNLQDVIIGGNAVVGRKAFEYLKNLQTVIMYDEIDSIGDKAFNGCVSLKEVQIGSKLTTIGVMAFFDTNSLLSITLPDTLESMGHNVFHGGGLANIYYRGSEAEWNEITIGSGNEKVHGALKEFNYEDDASSVERANRYQYILMVKNSQGQSMPNATITVVKDGKETKYETSPVGYIRFERDHLTDAKLTVSKEGFLDYTTGENVYALDKTGFGIIILYTELEAKYTISSAIYSEYTEEDVDLITGHLRIVLVSWTETTVSIRCRTASKGYKGPYRFYQNDKLLATEEDGNFSIPGDLFEKGNKFYVATVMDDGREVRTLLNLEVVDDSFWTDIPNIKFGEKLTFTVNEDVPVFGGSAYSIKLPELPAEFVWEEGRLYLSINFKYYDSKKGKKSYKDQWRDFKEGLEKIPNDIVSKAKEAEEAYRELDAYLKYGILADNVQGGDFFKKSSAEPTLKVNFVAGGEVTWSNHGDGLDKIQVQGYILLTASVGWKFDVVIETIPCTFEVKVGMKASAKISAGYDLNEKEFFGEIKITVNPSLDVFGGVGHSKIGALGVYGKLGLELTFVLADTDKIGDSATDERKIVDSATLTGEIGFKAYAYIFTHEKKWDDGTWPLYPEPEEKKARIVGGGYGTDLYNAGNYTLADLSYLNEQSAWLGQQRKVARSLSGADSSEMIEIMPLRQGTYRNMQPVVAASSNDVVMAYISADTYEQEGNNSLSVVYSVYDAATATWSTPMYVNHNHTADAMPYLYSDGETIRLVYLDSAVAYDEENGINLQDEYVRTQNVAVYVYDHSSGSFVQEKTFETAGSYYHSPLLTSVNGVPTLTWVSGEGSDIFGQCANNTILCSRYENGQWSDPSALITDMCTIVDYAVGEVNSALNVLYSLDQDNNLQTEDDRVTMLFNGQESRLIQTGAAANMDFVQLPGAEQKSFIWIADQVLCSLDQNNESQAICYIGSAESVEVMGDKILFTVGSETAEGAGNSEIFAVVYDKKTGNYSSPVQISNQDRYIEKVSGVTVNGTEILIMTRKAVTITEEHVEDDCEFAWAVLHDQAALRLDDVVYDYDDISDGQIPLTLWITNEGAVAADQYTVSIQDKNGNVVVEQPFDEPLLAGETKEITVKMPLENVNSIAEFTVSLLDSVAPECDATVFTIGYADLSVSVQSAKVGKYNTLVCTVTNEGLSSASGRLLIYEGSEANLLSARYVNDLAPGESMTFFFEIVMDRVDCIVTCEVRNEVEDYSESNNTDEICLNFESHRCWEEYEEIVVEPSCTAEGSITQICSCGNTFVQITHEKEDHVFDDDRDADCNQCGFVREIIIYGDANGDGAVNNMDVAVLQKYVSGWEVTLDMVSADVNADGAINNSDVALLQRYTSGWDVTLGKQT